MTARADYERRLKRAIDWLRRHPRLPDDTSSEFQRRYGELVAEAEHAYPDISFWLLEFGPDDQLRPSRVFNPAKGQ